MRPQDIVKDDRSAVRIHQESSIKVNIIEFRAEVTLVVPTVPFTDTS